MNKFLENAFSRLGNQGDVLGQVAENTRESADAVAVGGDLYEKVNELTKAVTAIQEGDGGGGGLKNAMAIALVAPSMEPLGKGLQFVVDAINNLEGTGDEIKAKTEALVGGLVLLGDVGLAILKFAGYLALATPLLIIAAIGAPLIAVTLLLLTKAIQLSTKKLDEESLEKVKMLGDVGKSILILVGSLALASLIMPLALSALLPTLMIVGLFALLSVILPPKRVDNIKAVGEGMLQVALGLGAMVLVLALTSLIIAPAIKGALAAAAIMVILGIAFLLIPRKAIDKMEDAGKGLLFAAGAILGLAIALALFNIIAPPLATLLDIALIVGVVGLTFGIIGLLFAKHIEKGAKALMWAGLSIVVLGLSILFFSKVIGANMGGEDIVNSFLPLLLIGAIGAAFYLAGKGATEIAKGAGAMIIGAIAIILTGVGVLMMKKALGDNGWELIGQTLALLTGIGVVMALAGVGAMFILPGAAALLVAGIAMVTIGAGLLVMGKAYANAGVKAMMEENNGELGIVTLFKGIADAFVMWPWTAAGIALGAGSMIMAGIALITVGAGLRGFAKLVESGIDLPSLASNISLMIGTLALPFQKIGAGEDVDVIDPKTGKPTTVKFGGSTGGFLGLGGSNPVSDGIQATMNMGKALTGIAGGVQSMANLKFPTAFDKDGKASAFETIGGDAFNKVIKNTMMMVGSLALPFARIGAGGKVKMMGPDGEEVEMDFGKASPGGVMGFLKGGGDIQKGIKAVMNMGTALTNIAGGVQSMANLRFPQFDPVTGEEKGHRAMTEDDFKNVSKNTQSLVKVLGETFATIGKDPDAQSPGWFGQSNIEKGIEIVTGVGKPLLNLAKGVQAMANLKFPIYDKEGNITGYDTIKSVDGLKSSVGENTRKLIEALTDTLTTIGKDGEGASSWWSGTNNFEKGIEIVSMIGEPYKVLGESVKTIIEVVGKMDSSLFKGKMQDIISVFTSDEIIGVDSALMNSKKLLTLAIGDTFEKLGDSVPAIADGLAKYKPEQGKAFFGAFIGPVDPKDISGSYNNQKLLWNAIGHSMVQTKDSMPGITAAVNEMDMEKLVESRKMFEALGVLAKGGDPGDILASMGQSLEAALQNLADMLTEFKGSVEEGVAAQGEATGGLTGAIKSILPKSQGGATAASNAGGNDDVVSAVENLQRALVSQGIKIKKGGSSFFD